MWDQSRQTFRLAGRSSSPQSADVRLLLFHSRLHARCVYPTPSFKSCFCVSDMFVKDLALVAPCSTVKVLLNLGGITSRRRVSLCRQHRETQEGESGRDGRGEGEFISAQRDSTVSDLHLHTRSGGVHSVSLRDKESRELQENPLRALWVFRCHW